jgi:mitofusin
VNIIKQLGILHGGNEFENIHFRPEVMFSRRRDALAREVDVSTEIWDFIPVLFEKRQDKMGAGMALTVATAVSGPLIGAKTMMGQMGNAMSMARYMSRDGFRSLLITGALVIGMFPVVSRILAK